MALSRAHGRPSETSSIFLAGPLLPETAVLDDMRAAYSLISDYKAGRMAAGSDITEPQQRRIRLLATDLEVQAGDADIAALVGRVARADSHWNRQAMDAVAQFYSLREAGDVAGAEAVRDAFQRRCPSVWYCRVLADL